MSEIHDKKNKLICDLCTINKTIDDVIYGTIQFSKFASCVIDSKEFQRLRNMRQLGVADFVFPNACHTRFVHSLGTYFQCKELTKRLADVTPLTEMNEYLRCVPELTDYIEKNYKEKKCEFDKYLQELVNIAALCHDLGHGPFSHLFDDIFIKKSELKEHENAMHERRSQLLIEIIIKKSSYLSIRISNEHIKFIQNIIDPPKNAKGFLYQIVSNNLNSLDVDKFDYITRDMRMIGEKSSFNYKKMITQAVIADNMISYPKECAFNIMHLFNMRHTMHRQIYNNTGVVSAQLMMADMMSKINQILNISESIKDMNKFCEFTDSVITEYPSFLKFNAMNEENLQETTTTHKSSSKSNKSHDNNDLIQQNESKKAIINDIITLSTRFKTHNAYHLIYAFVLDDNVKFDKNVIFKDDFSQHLDDIIIYTSTVGFVSGNKANPLDNIYLYEDIKYKDDKIQYIGNTIQKNKHGITNLISNKYQEHLTMVYFKKNDENVKKTLIPKIKDHLHNYISQYLKQCIVGFIEI